MKTEKEIIEDIEGKSKEEIRNYIIEQLVAICDEAEKLSVNEEDYETAGKVLKSKERIKKL
jgi:hypothetical protein